MTDLAQPEPRFRVIARGKLADAHVQGALAASTERLRAHRLTAWNEVDDVQELRRRGHDIKMRTIDDLDRYLEQFREALEARGGRVHFAATAEDATPIVSDICRRHGVKTVAKAKSMASEEIGLNHALEAVGIQAIETDLGEWILQLAGEHPVHIVAPAIEKTATDVAEMFSRLEGREVGSDLQDLLPVARARLR